MKGERCHLRSLFGGLVLPPEAAEISPSDAKMSKKCAKCEKTVYPTEELKCLEKVGH